MQRLVLGTQEQTQKAAYEIHVLIRTSIFNRACLIEVGTVSPLLEPKIKIEEGENTLIDHGDET